MANIIYARVMQKTATLDEWMSSDLVLLDGEQAFVVSGDGTPINFKIGDGTKTFSELPFWIQYDQAQYISVEGTSLPTPSQDAGYSLVGPGTYTQSGGPDIVVPYGIMGVLSWDGSVWSLTQSVELPQVEGTDTLEEEEIPKGKAVKKYALERNTRRIFPSGYEVFDLDRPDLTDIPDIVFVSENGYVISNNYGLDYSLLRNYSFEHFDRPDLGGIIEVDSQYYILSGGTSGGKVISSDYDVDEIPLFAKKYYEQSPVDAFVPADFYNYDNLIAGWDAIMIKANIASTYCTKKEVGRSSTKDMPIYTYEFKPEKPRYKVLLSTGLHGSEKVYIHLLQVFFDRFMDSWTYDPLLQWLRLNVHFIVVPCLSPSCMEGLTPASTGGRRVHETTPIDVSWDKVGNTATVSFEEADFPNTDGRLDANTYFSNPNIVGKTWVSIFDSTNTALANKGYVIDSVINGRTITVKTDNEISGNGTAKLYVGVDINRNMQADGSIVWNDFTPTASSSTIYSNDYVPNPNDNKGTKPFSLSESIVLRDLILDNPDIMFYTDLHSGAGNNYLHWNTKAYDGQVKAIDELKEYQSIFNSDGYSRVSLDNINIPYSTKYVVEEIDKPGFTLEWQQLPQTTEKEATDASRWLTTFLISFIRNLKK